MPNKIINARYVQCVNTDEQNQLHPKLLFRSSVPRLSHSDLDQFYLDHGISRCVDLRSRPLVIHYNTSPFSQTIITNHTLNNDAMWQKQPDIHAYYKNLPHEEKFWKTVDQCCQYLLNTPANHSLMIHCSAGKDRTGMLIAAILMLLDMPEHAILNDYCLSNEYQLELQTLMRTIAITKQHPTNNNPRETPISDELWKANPSWLESFMAEAKPIIAKKMPRGLWISNPNNRLKLKERCLINLHF